MSRVMLTHSVSDQHIAFTLSAFHLAYFVLQDQIFHRLYLVLQFTNFGIQVADDEFDITTRDNV